MHLVLRPERGRRAGDKRERRLGLDLLVGDPEHQLLNFFLSGFKGAVNAHKALPRPEWHLFRHGFPARGEDIIIPYTYVRCTYYPEHKACDFHGR